LTAIEEQSMEDIIGYVVFAIFIISSIVAEFRKRSTGPAKEPGPTGEIGPLDPFEEIKRRLMEQRRREESRSPRELKPEPPAIPARKNNRSQPPKVPSSKSRQAEIPAAEIEPAVSLISDAERDQVNAAQTAAIQVELAEEEATSQRLNAWRNALVLSEILGPPRAMKMGYQAGRARPTKIR
jgi:hypothetical protein